MAARARVAGDRWDAAAGGTLLLFRCRQIQGYSGRIVTLHKRARERERRMRRKERSGKHVGIRQGNCVLCVGG
jgi:hypothetical protein